MTVQALVFEGVTKTYDIGRNQGSLADAVASFRRRPRREAGKRQRNALDDVSFSVPEGEAFAIIGDNGAGKTTALKIATRLVHPTSGTVKVRGRVGALIEVGSGLHPDLTGRENLDLFGRILGISRADIARNYERILDFAEIGAAVEQPVKQYSSGMQLRLGFAIAAHLEPDVLIVDEAIAVGDVGFQRKCLERMAQLVRDGRTLIFVSHDLLAIETLCRRAVRLDQGRIVDDGPAASVVAGYLGAVDAKRRQDAPGLSSTPGPLNIERVTVHDADGTESGSAQAGGSVLVRIHYHTPARLINPLFSVGITEGHQNALFIASMAADGKSPGVIEGSGSIDCVVELLPLSPNTYDIWLSVLSGEGAALIPWQRGCRFEVRGANLGSGIAAVSVSRMAPVVLPYHWVFTSDSPRL